MTQQTLLKIIRQSALVDYKALATEQAFQLIPKLLRQLLGKAEQSFEKLLKTPQNQIKFTGFFEYFLTNDRELGVLFQAVNSLNSTHTSEETRKIITNFQPKLVDYHNKVNLNRTFYDQLKFLERQNLKADQRRSLELVIRDMEVAGVHLDGKKRRRVEEINKKLSELGEKFSQNVTDSRADFFYEINDDSIVSEMPEADLRAAAEEAKRRKSKAKYIFTLSQPSYIAVVRYCSDAKMREKFYKANYTLASKGKWNNRPLALKILTLRQEKARLLGFKNYTEYVLQERMAPSFKAVETILKKVSQKAGKAAKTDIKELTKYAGHPLQAWDLAYYSEKLKKEKFDVDDKIIQEYFPMEQVIEGLFLLMEKLFNVTVKQIKNKKTYHPEARIYQVYHGPRLIAYYLLDPHARPEKRGGAWADDLRTGYTLSTGESLLPIVINVCNFPKGFKDKPTLLTHRDVETLFHEFGHALHLMLSSKGLPNLNGFHTEWDFVEMPSQILENWCWEPESLKLFAKHFKTGKVIPASLIQKLRQSKTFMSGLFLTRQNEFGFLDLTLHSRQAPKTLKELDQLSFKITNHYSALPKFKEYCMYASFSHIFAGGYAAGYYSYVWAEVLEADIFEAIKKGGVMNRAVGKRYAQAILAQGSKKSAVELFKDFMGREPKVEALFKKHGVK